MPSSLFIFFINAPAVRKPPKNLACRGFRRRQGNTYFSKTFTDTDFFSFTTDECGYKGQSVGKAIKRKGDLVTHYPIIFVDVCMNSRCRILKSQTKKIATSQKKTEFTSSTWVCSHNTDQGFEFVRHLAPKKSWLALETVQNTKNIVFSRKGR